MCCRTGTEDALSGREPAALNDISSKRSHSILARSPPSPTWTGKFPLGVETARKVFGSSDRPGGGSGAYHPPIGAQGFNLGLRDIATVAELVADAIRDGDAPGGDRVTGTYDRSGVPDPPCAASRRTC